MLKNNVVLNIIKKSSATPLHRMLVWVYMGLLLLITAMYTSTHFFEHTQLLEFRFYQIACFGAALFFFSAAYSELYLPIPEWAIRALLFFSIVAFCLFPWLVRPIAQIYYDARLFLVALSFGLPFFLKAVFHWWRQRDFALDKTSAFVPCWIGGLHVFLLNWIALNVLLAYIFAETAPYAAEGVLYRIGWFSLGIGTLILGTTQSAFFFKGIHPDNWKEVKQKKQFAIKCALLLFFAFLMFFIFQRELAYFDYSPYLGATYDVLQGKSLLYDTPSIYGYLSIRIAAVLLGPLGYSFKTFYLYNTILYVLFHISVIAIFTKLFRSYWISIAAFLLTVGLQLQFWTLDPSSGPLRFGMGMLMLLLSVLFVNRSFTSFLGLFLSATAVFWSAEAGLFVLPAWIFAYTSDVLRRKDIALKKRFLQVAQRTAYCISSVALVGFLVLITEYRPGSKFPNPGRIYEYMLMYKNVYDANLFPAIGSYWFSIPIILFSLGLTFFLLLRGSSSKWYSALAFISIHNVAVLSYYVTQSYYEYIIHIAIFYFLALALSVKVIHEEFSIRWPTIRLLLLPMVVGFCGFLSLLSGIILFRNASVIWDAFHTQILTAQGVGGNPIEQKPVLHKLRDHFQLSLDKVIVLSKDNDTKLIVDSGVVNLLPINPASMLYELPWEYLKDVYLEPALKELSKGTVVIGKREQFEQTFSLIESYYELEYIGKFPSEPAEPNDIYDEGYNPWLAVYQIRGRNMKEDLFPFRSRKADLSRSRPGMH